MAQKDPKRRYVGKQCSQKAHSALERFDAALKVNGSWNAQFVAHSLKRTGVSHSGGFMVFRPISIRKSMIHPPSTKTPQCM